MLLYLLCFQCFTILLLFLAAFAFDTLAARLAVSSEIASNRTATSECLSFHDISAP